MKWRKLFSSNAERQSAPLLCVLVGMALTFTPLAFGARSFAQSGRNQKPSTRERQSTPTRRPAPQAGPRRAATEPTPRPTPTPQERVPSDPSLLGEPPAWPTPTPRPSPATPPASAAETSIGEEVDAEDIVRINSNLVTVPASVIDAQGRPVTDLKLEDFELRVDGQPKPITELGSSETPVTLAVLFDNSSSQAAAREFEKQAATRFFRSVLRPIDKAAIYSVSTYPVLEQPLTSDVRTLVRTIERFAKPEGATALFDAVVQAANYLRPFQEGRKVIVIVSDGSDTISDIDFDSALQRAQAADCQIYAVQTGHIENANLRDLAAERRLQDFAGQTGGAVYVPRGTSDLDTAFAQISADLAQQYVLSYYPNDERRDNLFRTISVRVITRPNLRVRARKGYYPRRTDRFSGNSQTPTRNEMMASLGPSAPVEVSKGASEGNSERSSSISSSSAPILSPRAGGQRDVQTAVRSGPAGPPDPDTVPADRGAQSSATDSSAGSNPPAPASSKPAPTTTPKSEPVPAPSAPTTGARTIIKEPVPGGVLNGKAISLPVPNYPESARRARAHGSVSVDVTIDEHGNVISARAISGHSLLHAAAVAAARRARFTPTLLSGQPVKVRGMINYNFSPAP